MGVNTFYIGIVIITAFSSYMYIQTLLLFKNWSLPLHRYPTSEHVEPWFCCVNIMLLEKRKKERFQLKFVTSGPNKFVNKMEMFDSLHWASWTPPPGKRHVPVCSLLLSCPCLNSLLLLRCLHIYAHRTQDHHQYLGKIRSINIIGNL